MPSIAREWATDVPGYLVWGATVWRLQRVDSAALLEVGYAHLEGSETYAQIQAELAQEQREAVTVGTHPPADQEAVRQRLREVQQRRTLRAIEALEATPDGRRALLERADAYVCAGVDAAARLAGEPAETPQLVRVAPQLASEWEPFAFRRAEHDPDAGVVDVRRLPIGVRHIWGQLLQHLYGGITRARVDPFRSGPAAAPGAAPAGGGVQHGPGGDRGDLEPGAGSDRPRGARRARQGNG